MTEVPDYLLQRSKARRRALGLAVDDDGDDGGGGGAAPAAAAGGGGGGSQPTQLAPIPDKDAPTPPPEPAYVTAAKTRRKPPIWVAALFSLLPLYLFLYVALLGSDTANTETALGLGAELYASQCASCHLGNGAGSAEGGVGQSLYQGEVERTFPEIAAQFDYVRHGSFAAGEPYGDPNREGGVRIAAGGMPGGWANLTDYQLYAIVRYERETLSGEELAEDVFLEREETWATLQEDGGTHEVWADTAAGGE